MKNFFDTDDRFALSYELICFFGLIVKNNPKELKTIVKQAFDNGLLEDVAAARSLGSSFKEEMHITILDFFQYLEELIQDEIDNEISKKAKTKKLLPELQKIDQSVYNDIAVTSSIQKATKALEKNPELNPKEQLLKEILKNWKPGKKELAN